MHNNRIWVLLRGLAREQRHWGDFPAILQARFPEDDIVLYDFPGNGRRCNEKSATTIMGMVDDLRKCESNRFAQQPVHIIALSLGAMAAVQWLDRYPGECEAAILISTSLRGLNPFYQRLLPSAYPAVLRALLVPGSIRQKESTTLKLVSNIIAGDKDLRELTIEQWVSYARQCPVSAGNGLRQLLAAMRFRVPSQRPEVPILVLRSLADRMVSPECSLNLSEHWDLPMQTHIAAGHDIPLDDGYWVCEKIYEWLER